MWVGDAFSAFALLCGRRSQRGHHFLSLNFLLANETLTRSLFCMKNVYCRKKSQNKKLLWFFKKDREKNTIVYKMIFAVSLGVKKERLSQGKIWDSFFGT